MKGDDWRGSLCNYFGGTESTSGAGQNGLTEIERLSANLRMGINTALDEDTWKMYGCETFH